MFTLDDVRASVAGWRRIIAAACGKLEDQPSMIQFNDPAGYLMPKSVDEHADPDGDVEIRIYSNGVFEVAPHPDSEKAAYALEQHRAGVLPRFRVVRVQSSALMEPE